MGIVLCLFRWVLVPLCLVAAAFLTSYGPDARAADQLLSQPGRDVLIQTSKADAYAHFQIHRNGLELHILIHERDGDGELIRTRVILADGQSYQIMIDADDDTLQGQVSSGFAFVRRGKEIVARPIGEDLGSLQTFMKSP
ncbi:MAG: hypothetical protein AB8B85_02125 [Paracoccaceae bacterium]